MSVRRFVLAALLVVVVLPVANAHATSGRHKHPDFVPVHRLGGATDGELLRQWWSQVLRIPASENPLTSEDSPARCITLGKRSRVAATISGGQTSRCRIKVGTPLFLPVVSAECSSAEPEPYFGATEEEQRACAIEIFDDQTILAIRMSLDGRREVDMHRARFRTVSPQGHTVFPPDPIFDAESGPATFVGASWTATLRKPLRPGRHTIVGNIDIGGTMPFTVRFKQIWKVVRHHHR